MVCFDNKLIRSNYLLLRLFQLAVPFFEDLDLHFASIFYEPRVDNIIEAYLKEVLLEVSKLLCGLSLWIEVASKNNDPLLGIRFIFKVVLRD